MMSEIRRLRARAAQLRAAATEARDPDIARALCEVAAAFDDEAEIEAVETARRGGGR